MKRKGGCNVKSVLFCFPGLVFEGDKKWTKHGLIKINKIKEKTLKT